MQICGISRSFLWVFCISPLNPNQLWKCWPNWVWGPEKVRHSPGVRVSSLANLNPEAGLSWWFLANSSYHQPLYVGIQLQYLIIISSSYLTYIRITFWCLFFLGRFHSLCFYSWKRLNLDFNLLFFLCAFEIKDKGNVIQILGNEHGYVRFVFNPNYLENKQIVKLNLAFQIKKASNLHWNSSPGLELEVEVEVLAFFEENA